MIKPSWENAPDWAEFLAADYDGEWFWYDSVPSLGAVEWYAPSWVKTSRAMIDDWENTLERRPDAAVSKKTNGGHMKIHISRIVKVEYVASVEIDEQRSAVGDTPEEAVAALFVELLDDDPLTIPLIEGVEIKRDYEIKRPDGR